ncbi:MAG: response regulator transcription factor [Fibrobacteres bacterium]|nr:response regulator transcription factor [Fibrobacterota bacterium]
MGLRDSLEIEGYSVVAAEDGLKGESLILSEKPDLVLLDIMMPGIDGLTVCKRIREKGFQGFVLMLTAKKEELDKVAGFRAGADDYMIKPFSLMELLAKIKAVFRRFDSASGGEADRIITGRLEIDIKRYEVKLDGQLIDLPGKEFDILKYLSQHPDEVVSRDDLLNAIWGYDVFPSTRTIDNFMVRLRQKLEVSPENPEIIKSIRGVGYKFCTEKLIR